MTFKRFGTQKFCICPLCEAQMIDVDELINHLKNKHEKTIVINNDESTNFKVILLGLSSSAIFEFIKWTMENVPLEKLHDAISQLFCIASSINFYSVDSLDSVLDSVRESKSENKENFLKNMEKGLLFLDDVRFKLIEAAFFKWINKDSE
ncbi:MAG: hypothetical protein V2B20_26955 [Pseudomonadota bacterium]